MRDDPYVLTPRARAAAQKKPDMVPMDEHLRALGVQGDNVTLREGIEALRWHLLSHWRGNQGGWWGYSREPRDNGSHWCFTLEHDSTALDLDKLFALAGIRPNEIGEGEPDHVGRCSSCGNAKISPRTSERVERGYEGPCLDCERPLMSHWVPVGQLSKRKDGKPWLPIR